MEYMRARLSEAKYEEVNTPQLLIARFGRILGTGKSLENKCLFLSPRIKYWQLNP